MEYTQQPKLKYFKLKRNLWEIQITLEQICNHN